MLEWNKGEQLVMRLKIYGRTKRSIETTKYAFISSTVLLLGILSYSTLEWIKDDHIRPTFEHVHLPPLQLPEIPDVNIQDHYLCSTNSSTVLRQSQLPIFVANIAEDFNVFVTNNNDIGKIFNKYDFNWDMGPCGKFYNQFEYICCAYSPNSRKRTIKANDNAKAWNFKYNIDNQDNNFRITDVSALDMIKQSMTFKYSNMFGTTYRLSVKHKCRSDISIDRYPEVHINVTIGDGEKENTTKMFHWYLS